MKLQRSTTDDIERSSLIDHLCCTLGVIKQRKYTEWLNNVVCIQFWRDFFTGHDVAYVLYMHY